MRNRIDIGLELRLQEYESTSHEHNPVEHAYGNPAVETRDRIELPDSVWPEHPQGYLQ